MPSKPLRCNKENVEIWNRHNAASESGTSSMEECYRLTKQCEKNTKSVGSDVQEREENDVNGQGKRRYRRRKSYLPQL